MKIRLHGPADEIEQAAERIAQTFRVISVSEPYQDRGGADSYRVYIEVRLNDPATH